MNLKLNEEQVAYVNGLEDPEAKKAFLINCFITQCEEEIKKEESGQENLLKFDLPEKYPGDRLIASGLAILALKHKSNIERIDPDEPEEGNMTVLKNGTMTTTTFAEREKFDKFIEDNGLKKFTPPESKENLLKLDLPEQKEYLLTRNDIIEVLQQNPSLDICIEMKNLCAKRGEYELCAKFREKEKQLLEKSTPQEESLSKEQLKDITKPLDVDGVKYFFSTPYIVGGYPYQLLHPKKVKKYTKEDLQHAFEASRQDIMGITLFEDFDEYFRAISE